MAISLIVACDESNAIGNNNQLLCHLPNDLKHFKNLTINNYIVMGRKTFQSIGKALSNRHNIVLTRKTKHNLPPNIHVYNSLAKIIQNYNNLNNNEKELFIIGGDSVYRQAIEYADSIYLTRIHHTFPKSDTFFPKLSDEWIPVETIFNQADEKNPYDHTFITYKRK